LAVISGILDALAADKGSRRSRNIVARRGGGTDCPRSLRSFGRAGSVEGWAARGTP